MTAVIAVERLTKDFGPVRAVDDLSFGIEAGTVLGFLGPNGSGKTTTLRSVVGLVEPTSGTATVSGVAYADLHNPLSEVGVMLEAAAHPARTARNHLRIIAAEAGVPASRADELLKVVDLADAARRRVGGFSLGMHQRLGLAAALIGNPAILILDEPANGLDPEGIRWLRDFLRGLASEGRTVLLSSHVLAEVAQTVDADRTPPRASAAALRASSTEPRAQEPTCSDALTGHWRSSSQRSARQRRRDAARIPSGSVTAMLLRALLHPMTPPDNRRRWSLVVRM